MTDRRWILHLFGLWALAVCQPLLDLLGRSPEFFVAHRAGPLEILLVLVILGLLLPLPLIGVVWAAGLLGRRARTGALAAAVALLCAMVAAQVVGRAGVTGWRVALPLAALAGILAATAYLRIPLLRTFVSVLSIGVVIVPGVFLLQPGVRRLLAPSRDALANAPPPDPTRFRPAPVVFLVVDEAPLVSLLDEDSRIDSRLYPNIAALARDGRWFRNATAVSDYTQWAVPSMVTGQYPRPKALPNAAEYPNNLFTLLGRTHRLQIVEAVTDLCPERLCSRDPVTVRQRVTAMGSDIRILWLHVILPPDLRTSLPPLTNDWANFDPAGWRRERRRQRAARRQRRPDKLQIVERFIAGIGPGDAQPTFYFLHTLLTHFPHELLLSGQRNATRAAIPGEVDTSWNADEWAVAQHYQRHLMQIGLVDRLLGRLIDRLKTTGLYDRALIVFAADHGIAYQPSAPRRAFTSATAAEILRVPLIVKLPAGVSWRGGARGREGGAEEGISDRNVETIDLAPTIADALGLPLPWKADGASLLDASAPARVTKRVMFASGARTQEIEPRGPDAAPAVARKIARFGAGENPWRVPRPGRFGELVGRSLDTFAVVPTRTRVDLRQRHAFERMDPRRAEVPFDIAGLLTPRSQPAREPVYVAVAVNGTIRTVTRTWETQPEGFLATPPLDVWREGHNDVDLFIVDGSSNGPLLRRLLD